MTTNKNKNLKYYESIPKYEPGGVFFIDRRLNSFSVLKDLPKNRGNLAFGEQLDYYFVEGYGTDIKTVLLVLEDVVHLNERYIRTLITSTNRKNTTGYIPVLEFRRIITSKKLK